MFLHIILSALQQSLIFLPLALGIYISYEVLVLTDLTVGGTFVLGASIFARLFTTNYSQSLAIIFALLGGFVIGVAVCIMQRAAKINSLIAGILAVFMLYSINFMVMGRPTIGLTDNRIFLQTAGGVPLWGFLLAFTLILMLLLMLLLRSRVGLILRALGSNPYLVSRLGFKSAVYLALGLGLSNLLAALSGVMTAQANGFSSVQMGEGMALVGIGAVVIGCQLVKSLLVSRKHHFSAALDLFCCFIGVYIYFLALNALLASGLNPIYLKLFLGLLLVFFLSTAHYSGRRGEQHGELAQIK
ncbi:MAG: ABC transporter permease [Pseudomonadota bacterium]